MRFSDLCEKEVVNVSDCRCLGNVRDLEFDKECGDIKALIIPGPGKYFGCFKYLGINTKTSLLSGRNACDRYFQCLRLRFHAFGCPFLVLLSVGRMLMQSALVRFDTF